MPMWPAAPTGSMVYRQHAQFVQDYQFWGHWAHKRTDAQGRIYYLSPEVILGNARGRAVEPARLRRVFRLRQLTRQVRQQGQIRLHNFGLYIDQGLWGQTVDVLIYDEAVRIEQAEHCWCPIPVSMTPGNAGSPPWMGPAASSTVAWQVVQLMFWALELVRTVWRMPRYRRAIMASPWPSAPQVGLFE